MREIAEQQALQRDHVPAIHRQEQEMAAHLHENRK